MSLENVGLGHFPFKLTILSCGGVIATSRNVKGVDGLLLYIQGAFFLLDLSCIIKNLVLKVDFILLWSSWVSGSCPCSMIFLVFLLQQYLVPFNSE